jgi:hypothetical protein
MPPLSKDLFEGLDCPISEGGSWQLHQRPNEIRISSGVCVTQRWSGLFSLSWLIAGLDPSLS